MEKKLTNLDDKQSKILVNVMFALLVVALSFKNVYRNLLSINMVPSILNGIEMTTTIAVLSMLISSLIMGVIIRVVSGGMHGIITKMNKDIVIKKDAFVAMFEMFIIVEAIIVGLFGLLYFMQPIIFVAAGKIVDFVAVGITLLLFFLLVKKKFLSPLETPLFFGFMSIIYVMYLTYIIMFMI